MYFGCDVSSHSDNTKHGCCFVLVWSQTRELEYISCGGRETGPLQLFCQVRSVSLWHGPYLTHGNYTNANANQNKYFSHTMYWRGEKITELVVGRQGGLAENYSYNLWTATFLLFPTCIHKYYSHLNFTHYFMWLVIPSNVRGLFLIGINICDNTRLLALQQCFSTYVPQNTCTSKVFPNNNMLHVGCHATITWLLFN